MRKIGYIYKYNVSEKKGIVVFGQRGNTYRNVIKFSSSDCDGLIKTGMLCLFDLCEENAKHIKRLSLNNLDYVLLKDLVSWRKGDDCYNSWYYKNTNITFENLNDIIIPKKKNVYIDKDSSSLDDDLFKGLSDFLREHIKDDFENDSPDAIPDSEPLPTQIDELYDCFGKYRHFWEDYYLVEGSSDDCSVCILNIDLWTSFTDFNKKYYGQSVDEILFLYDIFVDKIRFNENGIKESVKRIDNCISDVWSHLLIKFTDEELCKIIKNAPLLQPALPVSFCKKHLELLSNEFGMPNVSLCRLFCLDKINNITSTTEYKIWKNNLVFYFDCCVKHIEGEGIPMGNMRRDVIKRLQIKLDERYDNFIFIRVKNYYLSLLTQYNDLSFVDDFMKDEWIIIGEYLDIFKIYDEQKCDDEFCEHLFKQYYKLPENIRKTLKNATFNIVNRGFIQLSEKRDILPYILNYYLRCSENCIEDETMETVVSNVNERFINLSDVEDLTDAYEGNFITENQYYNSYTNLIKNEDIYFLLDAMDNCKFHNQPYCVQEYIASRILVYFGFKSLDSQKDVSYRYDRINDMRGLLKWFKNGASSHFDSKILEYVEINLSKVLSDDDKWKLYEEKCLSNPGYTNIRKRLDYAYEQNNFKGLFLKDKCFQIIMCDDVGMVSDKSLIMSIVDCIDWLLYERLKNSKNPFLIFYIWIKMLDKPKYNPVDYCMDDTAFPEDEKDEYLNLNTVKKYFHYLHMDAQLKLFRYLFYRMSRNELNVSLEELYDTFVLSSNACDLIRLLVILLKAEFCNNNFKLESVDIEKLLSSQFLYNPMLLSQEPNIKDFLFECGGYQAYFMDYDLYDYYIVSGNIRTQRRDNIDYYVITFNDSIVNIYGDVNDFLNTSFIENARGIFETNFIYEKIDNEYWVSSEFKTEIFNFVVTFHLKDECNLFKFVRGKYYDNFNHIGVYDDKVNFFICNNLCSESLSMGDSLPFCWCNKHACVRTCKYITPLTHWMEYKIPDFIFILMGTDKNKIPSVWKMTNDISHYINYVYLKDNVDCHDIVYGKDKRILNENVSLIKDVYDEICDDDYYQDNENYDEENYRDDSDTYDRYKGSYAQDEMGYSDDDIDTIFDGDPDAYWNID